MFCTALLFNSECKIKLPSSPKVRTRSKL